VTQPELHADDLLDRDVRGLLTSEERARLEGHLALCTVCRFERTVRADFRAEFDAQSPPRQDTPRDAQDAIRAGAGSPRRPRVRWFAMVALLSLVAGVAGAKLSGHGVFAFLRFSPALARSATPLVTAGGLAKRAAKLGVRAPATEPVDETLVAATPSVEAAVARPATSVLRPHIERPVDAVPAPSTAKTLFEEARQARERGDYAIAVERYQRLIALFPSSSQALTTHAVLGRLLLDRGEPAAALRHFDAYISSGANTLGEEAQLGRALAFGRLGESVQEADAWRALLRQYPRSVHAVRASERLSALAAE